MLTQFIADYPKEAIALGLVKGAVAELADELRNNLKNAFKDVEAIELRRKELEKLRKELEQMGETIEAGEWFETDEGFEFIKTEDIEAYKARLADIELLTGESVETIAGLLEETFGEGVEIDTDALAKRAKIQFDNALNAWIDYDEEMKNRGRDSRLIELEEQRQGMIDALDILKMQGDERIAVIQDFADQEKELRLTIQEEKEEAEAEARERK